jgi:hypothetical protein
MAENRVTPPPFLPAKKLPATSIPQYGAANLWSFSSLCTAAVAHQSTVIQYQYPPLHMRDQLDVMAGDQHRDSHAVEGFE